MTRGGTRWHQLADAIQRSNLTAADKAVFRLLLDKADYATAELPARWTPTQRAIGRLTSHSVRQVKYSIGHLHRHGWLTGKGATGPGKTLEYTFSAGCDCDCTGRVHAPATGATEARTGATSAPERVQPTGATPQARPQVALRGNERKEVERQARACSYCHERPTGPGGILCPLCKSAIEHRNRTLWETA